MGGKIWIEWNTSSSGVRLWCSYFRWKHKYHKNTEAMLKSNKEVGLQVNTEIIWLYLATKMWNKITVYWLLINRLHAMLQNSSICNNSKKSESIREKIKRRLNLVPFSSQSLVFTSPLQTLGD